MSEHTKGKMKAGKINCGQFPIAIDGRHFAIIKFTHLIDMKQDEANAKELVHRWNAFEDGGLVEELRTACEAIKDNKNKIYGFDIGKAIKKVEAALAKS